MSSGHIPLQLAGMANAFGDRYYRVTGTPLFLVPDGDGWKIHIAPAYETWRVAAGLDTAVFSTRQLAARAGLAHLAASPLTPPAHRPRFRHASAKLTRVAPGRHEAFGGVVTLIRVSYGDGAHWKAFAAGRDHGRHFAFYPTLRQAALNLPYDTPADVIPEDCPA